MALEVLHNINLNNNQVLNFSPQQLASDPGAPFTGQLWLNTTENALKFYDGSSIVVLADAADLAGLLDFKGEYNAATNTPDLETATGSVKKGDTYVVSAEGSFFTETLSIGDMLYAKQDAPTLLAHWVRIEQNLNQASETVKGIAEIATQSETGTGTDDQRIVTPLKLKTEIDSRLSSVPAKYTQTGVSIGTTPGAQGINHALATDKVVVSVFDETTKEEYAVEVVHTDANNVTISALGVTKTVSVTVIG